MKVKVPDTLPIRAPVLALICIMPAFFPSEVRSSMGVLVVLALLGTRPSWKEILLKSLGTRVMEIALSAFLLCALAWHLYAVFVLKI